MSKKAGLIAILLIALVGTYIWFSKPNKIDGPTVTINGSNIKVEIADTASRRAKGLSGRESLEEDRGMLFIFPSEEMTSFWMADTVIPLDIIWIDAEKKVVGVEKNAKPCVGMIVACSSYQPPRPVKYAIEVGAGWIDKHKVQEGSVVEFSMIK